MSDLKQLASGLRSRKRVRESIKTHKANILDTQNTEVLSVHTEALNTGDSKRGRPRVGKRSNPDYQQVSAWVRRDTYERVTRRLFLEENRMEFSELVQILLEGWLPKK